MATLSAIRTKVRYLLDDDSATAVTPRWESPELNSYINEAYRWFYNDLVAINYDGITKVDTLDTVALSQYVTLPTDFLKARIVLKIEGQYKVPMRYIRNFDYVVDTSGAGVSPFAPTYDFYGDTTGALKMVLNPVPQTSQSDIIEIVYWPSTVEMSSDSESPIGSLGTQWFDLIALQAALWAKGGREEDDVSNLTQMLDRAKQPYDAMKEKLTNARSYVQPFDVFEY